MSCETVPMGLRRLLWFTYLLGAMGMGGELLIMNHTEGAWQWLPIGLISFSLLALVTQSIVASRWLIQGFRFIVLLIFLSAFAGIWLHFDGKAEFKLEMDPALKGWDLIWACIRGHSLPPVFAPGSMMLLGLLGIAWSYKHPSFYRQRKTLEDGV